MTKWNRRKAREDKAESERLRQHLVAATVRLDEFVEALRMELPDTSGEDRGGLRMELPGAGGEDRDALWMALRDMGGEDRDEQPPAGQ